MTDFWSIQIASISFSVCKIRKYIWNRKTSNTLRLLLLKEKNYFLEEQNIYFLWCTIFDTWDTFFLFAVSIDFQTFNAKISSKLFLIFLFWLKFFDSFWNSNYLQKNLIQIYYVIVIYQFVSVCLYTTNSNNFYFMWQFSL